MKADRGNCQKRANRVCYLQKTREEAARVVEVTVVAGMSTASQVVKRKWYIETCSLARGSRKCSWRNAAGVAVAAVENQERQSEESEHRQSMCCCYTPIDCVGHCCPYMRLGRMAGMRLTGSQFEGRRRTGDCSLAAVAVVVPGIARDCRSRMTVGKIGGGIPIEHMFGSFDGMAEWCLYSWAGSFRRRCWVRPRHCREHSSPWWPADCV
jgi:hypothetical protein